MKSIMETEIWAILLLATSLNLVSSDESMRCGYGQRGSLTATCFNADSHYLFTTPYKFDYLDKTLKCQNCSFSTIFSRNFDKFGNQLENIDLSNSKIEEIEMEGFVGLVFVKNMNLSYNKIKHIYRGTFKGIQMVRALDLSHNKIVSLLEGGFENLVHLQFLDLQVNVIETININAFKGLYSLTELNLKNNLIRDFEKFTFTNLTSLQVLNLENNYIKSLRGNEFSNLTALLELNLGNNKLISVEIDLKPNNILRRLFLYGNKISSISRFLKGLRSLEQLDVSNNIIPEIAQKNLQGLLQLRTLNLPFNKLKTLRTGAFTSLPHLEILNCSYNGINDIKITGTQSLNSLHTLDLSFNLLKDLDYVRLISKVPNLSYLRLENNVLPCSMEQQMNSYFTEDNFEFVLYDKGIRECVNEPTEEYSTEGVISFTTSEAIEILH